MAMTMMIEQTIERCCISNQEKLILTHPESLLEGEHYIYREGPQSDKPASSIVKFVAYTSCPAIVVVSVGSGQKVRCPRDLLFNRQSESNVGINRVSDEPV